MLHLPAASRVRTLVGAAAAVLFVPVLLGITACLKTPIGDPEHGWVDPRITGVWLGGDPDPQDHEAALWTFEPYDSRTWLVSWVAFHAGDQDEDAGQAGADAATAEPSATPAAEAAKAKPVLLQPTDVLRILGTLGQDRVTATDTALFKAWLTSIAGRRFLVLEPKVSTSTEQGFRPKLWIVYRAVLKDDRMELALVTGEVDDLDEVTTRGEAEQIIARRAADPDLYGDETGILYRIPAAAYDDVSTALGRAGFEQW